MDKDSRDNKFIRKPIYPGGDKAYKAFISSNLVYPEEAKENNITGQVRLKYGINYKGDVTEVKVLNSLGYGCDEEAIRIVKLLKFDVPKGPRKVRVLFHRTVRISFNQKAKKKTKKEVKTAPSNKQTVEPQQEGMRVSYTYTKNKSTSTKQAPVTKNKNYNYKVEF